MVIFQQPSHFTTYSLSRVFPSLIGKAFSLAAASLARFLNNSPLRKRVGLLCEYVTLRHCDSPTAKATSNWDSAK